MEGLLFGGAYLRREICISNSIGLALQMEGNLPFLLCFTLCFRAISKYKPAGGMKRWGGGGLYLEGRFNGGFFALRVWGTYIWRGLFSEFYSITAKNPSCVHFKICNSSFYSKNPSCVHFKNDKTKKTPKISSMNQ